jgi:serine/threonine-protein phosphatase 2B regulatory subunit
VGKYKDLYTNMGFSENDIAILYNYFCDIDKDASHNIDIMELMEHLNMGSVKEKYWLKKLFSMFDDDGSGTIDFHEFVVSTWSYCTLHRATLLLFTFDVYDTDHNGSLIMDEMNAMLKDLFGSDYQSKRAAVIAALEADSLAAKDGDFNIDDFRIFARLHGSILAPAFRVQNELRERIAGEKFWSRLANKRILLQKKKKDKDEAKCNNGKGKGKGKGNEEEIYVSAWELLELHTHSEYQLHPRAGKHAACKRVAKHGRRRSRAESDLAMAQFQEVVHSTGARGYRHNAEASTTHHTNATTIGDYAGDTLYSGLVDDKYGDGAGDRFVGAKVHGMHGAVLYEKESNVNTHNAEGARTADEFDADLPTNDQNWMHANKRNVDKMQRNLKSGAAALRGNVHGNKVYPKEHGKT